jgi:Putative ABC exporter
VTHPLVWLVWRDTRSAARGLLRRLAQPRGALSAAGLALFASILALTTRTAPTFGGGLSVYGPSVLALLVAFGAFSPLGLYFRPPDVQWLMPAPLTRHSLVLYNVAVRARTAVLSGLLLSSLPNWRGSEWWAAFTGYTLMFLLLQVSAQWLAVLRAWLAMRLSPATLRALGVALFALPALAIAIEMRMRAELDLHAFFEHSRVVALLTAPTRPFLQTVVATGALDWLANALPCLALLGALVAHICVLDVPYREAAVQHSARRARRFALMRSGGAASRGDSLPARHLPMFPRLGGAGPIAWRQIQELRRNPRGVLLLLSIVALVTGATAAIPVLRVHDPELTVRMGRMGIFLVTFLPLLMGDNLSCDFRRDLDRMDQLKCWPIPPLALAAGQIAPAAAVAASVQLLGIAAVAAATSAVSLGVTLLVMALMPVVSWAALCIDNLLFLWLPYRTVPEDPGDVGFVGRTFATALFKFVVLVSMLGATLTLGWVTLVTTGSPLAAIGVPLVTLLAICAAGTVAVGEAFRRFDVARHAPV